VQQKLQAIVLDITPYAEASVIVKAYTDQLGLQSFLVNGVRKQKPRFAPNLFQPLTLLEVVAYIRKAGGLHRVAEVNAVPPLVHIPYDTIKTSMALFMAEILYRSVREEEANPELFGFVDHAVQMLDLQHETAPSFHLAFLCALSRYLGFYPGGRYDALHPFFDLKEGLFVMRQPAHPWFIGPELSAQLQQLLHLTLEDIHLCTLSTASRRNLLRSLITYYELHHTQGFSIRSHEVLGELMG
jgi:DNA repair protein RecO (recombination protein O)